MSAPSVAAASMSASSISWICWPHRLPPNTLPWFSLEPRSKNVGQSTIRKQKKPNPNPSLFRAMNGGIGIPDVSFPQQGSSDFLLAQPARYFWILAPASDGGNSAPRRNPGPAGVSALHIVPAGSSVLRAQALELFKGLNCSKRNSTIFIFKSRGGGAIA